jgi:hypothetical protein
MIPPDNAPITDAMRQIDTAILVQRELDVRERTSQGRAKLVTAVPDRKTRADNKMPMNGQRRDSSSTLTHPVELWLQRGDLGSEW